MQNKWDGLQVWVIGGPNGLESYGKRDESVIFIDVLAGVEGDPTVDGLEYN